MIGEAYWSTGITVRWYRNSEGLDCWSASADFLDGGFCNDEPDKGIVSTEGKLHTRYMVKPGETTGALTAAIDVVKRDAKRLGIIWREPALYYPVDGESDDDVPPEGWRQMLLEQAQRIGWRTYTPAQEQAS